MIEHVGGRERVELVLVGEEPEMPDARVLRDLEMLRPDQHQVEPVRVHHGVALEELEQLAAALVLVDAADVDRERPLAR